MALNAILILSLSFFYYLFSFLNVFYLRHSRDGADSIIFSYLYPFFTACSLYLYLFLARDHRYQLNIISLYNHNP